MNFRNPLSGVDVTLGRRPPTPKYKLIIKYYSIIILPIIILIILLCLIFSTNHNISIEEHNNNTLDAQYQSIRSAIFQLSNAKEKINQEISEAKKQKEKKTYSLEQVKKSYDINQEDNYSVSVLLKKLKKGEDNNTFLVSELMRELVLKDNRRNELKKKENNLQEVLFTLKKKQTDKEEKIESFSKIVSTSEIKKLNELWGFDDSIKYKLLYRMSIDGLRFMDFHQKVDDIDSIIIIAKTSNGRILGAYTSVGFGGGDVGYRRDKKAVLYNWSRNKKYYVKNPDEAIYNVPQYGASFGNIDLFINEGYGQSKFPASYGSDDDESLELSDGWPRFELEEVEAFHIK